MRSFNDYLMKKKLEHLREELGQDWWLDGICHKCGSTILETGCNTYGTKNDYMNICLNINCDEHKWHYCGDLEFLEYYEHKSVCQCPPELLDSVYIVLHELVKRCHDKSYWQL
mgnify:CR=1 FL=1